MSLNAFLERLNTAPDTVTFEETMAVIDEAYHYQDARFTNGEMELRPGQSSGSCKIFAFGQLNGLSEQQTLHCFGDYYRVDVLGHPDGDGHQNIRSFMQHGWSGISFQGEALVPK